MNTKDRDTNNSKHTANTSMKSNHNTIKEYEEQTGQQVDNEKSDTSTSYPHRGLVS
jgi:hypothetical protein